jgi:hypothetical protein
MAKITAHGGPSVEGSDESSELAQPHEFPLGPEADKRRPDPVDYSTMKVEDLKAELDRRRALYERDGDREGVEAVTYVKGAKKDDLVVLLETDDEELAEG